MCMMIIDMNGNLKTCGSVLEEVKRILEKNQEAKLFIGAYTEYVHAIDDLVDEDKNVTKIDRTTDLASRIFNSNYWIKNRDQLYLIEQLIHVFYFVSVEWETSEELWKQRDARVISHMGYAMFLAVLLLETRDTLIVQGIAAKFMEASHLKHLGDMTPEVAYA